ncbi:MAG: hypothetical protein UV00_C0027G0015 [candidate division WWE3 bacterium GW2011_GWF1_42_14]|uniref:Uncharacterized protein n=1 Tax=candidate division WWE3 bacterium GW2011_GWF1_42_14 TaxID=1619138 RepID=A0A0G0YIA3_UNCKA|nr:MAG: hypothetical protein UV00_C0027G0015 [candidate division WWE3 bacterium GW2011_GWF1_42_14]
MGEKEILLKINELIRKAEDGDITIKDAHYAIKVIMPSDQQVKEYFTL